MIEAANRAESAAIWSTRLADGELPVGQHAEFQAWVDADPLNAQALEEVAGAWRAVEHYATSAPIMELRRAALASAHRSARAAFPQRWWARIIWTGIAAAFLVMIGTGAISLWFAPQVYRTGIGERRVVALSDGSKISLDGATEVRVSYGDDSRRLWLEKGRAKFEVAKDLLRPFSVTAANKVVVATGTAFSVERVQQKVRVILYEGHVALLEQTAQSSAPRAIALMGGANRIPADHLLIPGREIDLPLAQPTPGLVPSARVLRIDPVRSLSWEGGQLVFEDERLGTVIERMNRYATVPLKVADQATADLRISGVFHAGDTDALIQGLSAFKVEAKTGSDVALTLRR